MKLWQGRMSGDVDERLNRLNASISFDSRMYREDITGSVAHARMLGVQGIISKEDSAAIIAGLEDMLADIESGAINIDMSMEDIHTFTEAELTRRIGDAGKRLHTARSRNDQVALDFRMYCAKEIDEIIALIKELITAICGIAKNHLTDVMPGYTHLQRAQPVTLSHYIMAYANMLLRDADRLSDCKKRTLVMPLGSGALAGTTYPLDRKAVADELHFLDITMNSIDGVSDRDFAMELLSDLSIVMVHLSRMSEEICLWCSWEYRFMTLDDMFSTGSSIMPQKKNPDVSELIRGKSGRVIGDMTALITTMKALPLAYNKDMQEDKEAAFDAIDTVKMCLEVLLPMLETATFNTENMRQAAAKGFINATDCADYLVKKGVPFRDAYNIVGKLVKVCVDKNLTLETMPMSAYKEASDEFEEDVYSEIDLLNCVAKRNIDGGPSPEAVKKQIEWVESKL